MRLGSPGNNLKQALQVAQSYMFSSRYGGRPGVPKILIVFYNKPIEPGAFAVAKQLIDQGYKVASIGIGQESRIEDGSKLTGTGTLAASVKAVTDAKQVAQVIAVLIRPGKKV